MDLGDGHRLSGLGEINVILGKNGSGKSTLLRLMDQTLSRNISCIRYITPERGGRVDLRWRHRHKPRPRSHMAGKLPSQ